MQPAGFITINWYVMILWFIFCLAVISGLIYFSIKAVALVRKRYGLAPAILLTIGLLSLGSRPGSNEVKDARYRATTIDSSYQRLYSNKIMLDKNALFTTWLFYTLAEKNDSSGVIVASAMSGIEGLTPCLEWEPVSVSMVPATDSSYILHYNVVGTLEKRLLFFHHYDTKEFEGTINVKEPMSKQYQ